MVYKYLLLNIIEQRSDHEVFLILSFLLPSARIQAKKMEIAYR